MDVDEDEEDDDVEEDDVEEEDRSQDREAHFVRACAVQMYTDISEEPFCVEICRKSAVRQARHTRFVRACAVEMHTDTSQNAFCAEIYGENAGRYRYHLDWTPGLNTFRKNPFSVATLFGNKNTKHHVCGLKSKTPLFVSLNPPYNIINT